MTEVLPQPPVELCPPLVQASRTTIERVAAAIPAYDAQPWIGAVVEGTRAQLDDVLVIDDGSADATAAQAGEAGAEVLRLDRNRGKGYALRRAFEILLERGFDAVVTLDADGQHLPQEIPTLLAAGAVRRSGSWYTSASLR